ncbi:MAG: TolC family protein, partial [Bacteroidales bacterium]|nr:TolC family protein [Bacteroidales bacterium]
MMTSKSFLLLTWISFTGLVVQAQEVYDLNRCITSGLENNFAIQIARSNAEMAANNRTPGNAGFLPSVDLNGRYGGTINNTAQTYTTGGDTSYTGVHNTTTTAGVALGWDLFRGFSAQTTWKKLNELKLMGELNTQMTIEDFVADMASEYYYYIQQLQLYHNLAYAVSLSRERVRIDEERYLLGAASKLQLLQSQVYLNSDSSRYAKQLEVLRASQVRINRLMASENLGQHIALKDSTIYIRETLV